MVKDKKLYLFSNLTISLIFSDLVGLKPSNYSDYDNENDFEQTGQKSKLLFSNTFGIVQMFSQVNSKQSCQYFCEFFSEITASCHHKLRKNIKVNFIFLQT